MAAHIEGLVFPGRAIRLTTRLPEQLARLVEAWQARDDVTASLPLAPGERLLTTTCDRGGPWVAASERALYHHGGNAPPRSAPGCEWVRVGWEEVGSATWDPDECMLTLRGLLPTAPRRTVLHLPDGEGLADLARERVAWSALVRTEIDLGKHGTARVIGRRQPGTDELVWLVGLPGQTDTPEVQAVLQAALADLRSRLGV